jgi:hypothetical protein
MPRLEIARVMAFFSVVHEDEEYQCALVHWFSRPDAEADEDTGLWVVEPDYEDDGDLPSPLSMSTAYSELHTFSLGTKPISLPPDH